MLKTHRGIPQVDFAIPNGLLRKANVDIISGGIANSYCAGVNVIEEMFTQGRRPTVTTTTGKTGTVSDIFRGPDGTAIAFQVDFTSDSGVTVSQRVNFPRAGGWRIRTPRRKNRKSKKVGGYKSRKSRRRTFR
jgi:hypothetical protein